MANSKISELSELTTVANDDVLAIVDDSASETKKISFANLSAGISVGNATQLQFTALNNTGSTITKGSAVYVSGHTTETQVADADNTSAASMPAFGIVSDDIANGATGVVVIGGELSGINTSAFSVGDELFVCDRNNDRLQVFSLAGEHRRSITGAWKQPVLLCYVHDRLFLVEDPELLPEQGDNALRGRCHTQLEMRRPEQRGTALRSLHSLYLAWLLQARDPMRWRLSSMADCTS